MRGVTLRGVPVEDRGGGGGGAATRERATARDRRETNGRASRSPAASAVPSASTATAKSIASSSARSTTAPRQCSDFSQDVAATRPNDRHRAGRSGQQRAHRFMCSLSDHRSVEIAAGHAHRASPGSSQHMSANATCTPCRGERLPLRWGHHCNDRLLEGGAAALTRDTDAADALHAVRTTSTDLITSWTETGLTGGQGVAGSNPVVPTVGRAVSSR
jgi:hypothetical protein